MSKTTQISQRTREKLNKQVAEYVMKWTPKVQGAGLVTGWYDYQELNPRKQYKGIELPPWAWDISYAFSLLELRHFNLWTCDAGYGLELFTAPEYGDELIAQCFSNNLPQLICQAVVTVAIADYLNEIDKSGGLQVRGENE